MPRHCATEQRRGRVFKSLREVGLAATGRRLHDPEMKTKFTWGPRMIHRRGVAPAFWRICLSHLPAWDPSLCLCDFVFD